MLTIDDQALGQLAALLNERAGLKIAPDQFYSLRLALSTRMPEVKIDSAREYVRRLKGSAGEHELRSLLPLVTVGKTEFFRDARQFQALQKHILPHLLFSARREKRKARIWSAGCATGEEPYSLSMVLSELGAKPGEVDLLATDLNLAAVENAKVGRYPTRRLTGLSPERLQRFFQRTEDGYQVIPSFRETIRFEGQNLAAPVFSKIPPASLDLILCRNVIIYFDLPTIRGLMDRFLASLRPGAFLLLGYSESLFKVYDRFEMVEIAGAYVYRRAPPAPEPAAAPVPERPSKRPAAGTERPKPSRSRAPAPVPPAAKWPPSPVGAPGAGKERGRLERSPIQRINSVVAQMDHGDFDQALAAAIKLVHDEPDDLDALLTLGNVHSLFGRTGEAMEAFAQAIAREPLCVDARVFAGVAAIQAGDLAQARSELSKALFLEPSLAIGHYLLAQVQEKSGEHDGARRSYRNALAQLRHPQRPLAGHYPDMLDSRETMSRAARYALAALEEMSE